MLILIYYKLLFFYIDFHLIIYLKFFLNNEVFFTFHLEYNNIDYNKLEPLWHFMLLSGHLAPNNEDTSQAHLIHVIDKNFERVFKLCGILKN